MTPTESPAAWAEPSNTEVEAALLGALLANNRAYDRIGDALLPEHFYEPVHGRIFEAIAGLVEKGKQASPQVLAPMFENDEGMKEAGGAQYLYELAGSIISIAAVPDHAETIRDCYLRRELISNCRATIAEASEFSLDVTASQITEAHEEALYAATRTRAATNMVSAGGAFHELLVRTEAAMKRDTKVVGVPTGIAALDNALGGMQKSKLIVVGARPSMGKSALACNIAWNAALEGYSGVVFSQEMADYQIAGRLAAKETGLSVSDIDKGDLTMDQWRQIEAVHREIATNIRLHIDDSGTIGVAQIRSRIRRLARTGLDFVVIDYLGLINPSAMAKRYNRTEQVSEITRELKQIAKDFDIPIVLLSQLSRELERRDNKRPMLSDLRESGSIEQDADTVIFLYRDEYYLDKSEPVDTGKARGNDFDERHASWLTALENAAGVCEAIIAKNRQGPTRTVHLHFDGRTNTMLDHTPHEADEREQELEL